MVATRRSTTKKPEASPRDLSENSRSVTYRLPVEIMSEILLHIVEVYPLMRRTEPLNLVTSVCQRWRDIALASPHLWTAIVFNDSRMRYDENYKVILPRPKSRIQAFLKRSRNLPLDIVYKIDYASKSASHMFHFENLIAPHLTRCRTLYVRLNTFEQLKRVVPLPQGLEKIRSFNLDISTRYPPSLSLPHPVLLFHPDNGARLQHLRIATSYLPVSFDNIAPQELQNFTFSSFRASPSPDDVMEWLGGASLLEECDIAASGTPSRPPTDLPALRFMRIGCVNPLKVLQTSSLVRLDWTLPSSGIPDTAELGQAGGHLPSLRHLSIASLELGEFHRLLPFLQEAPTVVNLRIHQWVWDDVISLIRALAVKVPHTGEPSSPTSSHDSTPPTTGPSQYITDLLPSLQCLFMKDVCNNGSSRAAITEKSFDKLLKRDNAAVAFNNLLTARPALANNILNMKLHGAEVDEAAIEEMQREYTSLDRRVAEMARPPWSEFDWAGETDLNLGDW
ncbi:hypothetical protein DL93DRAFT_2234431 [Clavulina sp. PMI_390]|nr:hypothetical protein DL93DRAFT_2234431 [Clavulina sp. PMI_390]